MKLLAKKKKEEEKCTSMWKLNYTLKQLLDQTVSHRGTFKNDFNQMKARMQHKVVKLMGCSKIVFEGNIVLHILTFKKK